MLASAPTGNTSGEATIPTSNIRLEAMRQSVTKIGEMLPSSVEFATEVKRTEKCHTPRSAAKKVPAPASASSGTRDSSPAARCVRAQGHSSGTASAQRQNALATGPVSASRTRIGANAIEQAPASKAPMARVWARCLSALALGREPAGVPQ